MANGENTGNGKPQNGDNTVKFYNGGKNPGDDTYNPYIEEWALDEMREEVGALPKPRTTNLPSCFSKLKEEAEIQQLSKSKYSMGSFLLTGLDNILYSLLVFHPTEFLEDLKVYRFQIEENLSFLENENYSKMDRASLLDHMFVGTLDDMRLALTTLVNMKDDEWKPNNFRFGPTDKNPVSILDDVKSTARKILLEGHTYVTTATKSIVDLDQYTDLLQLYHHNRKKFMTLVKELNTLIESFPQSDFHEHELIEQADKVIQGFNIQSATVLLQYISEFMQPTFIEYLKENMNPEYLPLFTKFISTLSDIGSFDRSIFAPRNEVIPQSKKTVKIDARTKLVSFNGLEGLIQYIRALSPHNVEFLDTKVLEQAPPSLRQLVDQYAMVINLVRQYRPTPNFNQNIDYLENAVIDALQHIGSFFETPETWKPDFDASLLETVGERKLLSDFLKNIKIKVTKEKDGEFKKRICPISTYLEGYAGEELRKAINRLIFIELGSAKNVPPQQVEEIRKRILNKKGNHSVISSVIAS